MTTQEWAEAEINRARGELRQALARAEAAEALLPPLRAVAESLLAAERACLDRVNRGEPVVWQIDEPIALAHRVLDVAKESP